MATTTSRRPRGAGGQWATGESAPLNHVEELKQADGGLSVRRRIEEIFAVAGLGEAGADDLYERMKWWGLYTQRAPGLGPERTGDGAAALSGEHFMLRIRSDGGVLSAAQLRAIAWASEECGRGVADVTDRQNVQLHWISIADVPRIWERLEAVGLTSAMACGDVPRSVLGCPVAGRAHDEILDATPALEAIRAVAVGAGEFENLPRKFKTSVSGCAQQCAQPEINDVAFVGVRDARGGRAARGEVGYDLYVGGGLGSNPRFAERLGVFVRPDQVQDVWLGVARLFREHGYRKSRKRARLKFLMADLGPAEVRRLLEEEFLGYALADGEPAAPSTLAQRDHLGRIEQHDGRVALGLALRAGRTSGAALRTLADLADEHGSGQIRLTTQQKLVLLDLEPDRADEVAAAARAVEADADAGPFRRATMACTGIEFCKLALAETKATAEGLYAELDQRLPDFGEEVRIHVNGCPNSCARFQVADVGFMGARLPREDGSTGEGFLVHLGGRLGEGRSFGRKIRGVRVFAEDLIDYTEALLRRYLEGRDEADSFGSYVAGLDDEGLAMFAAVPTAAGAGAGSGAGAGTPA